ncbi:hypothetical protein CNEO3_90053 [Clostridium neonatale]|nr:hypothetical protein CNEO3_90053 [Clostridium neonatale]
MESGITLQALVKWHVMKLSMDIELVRKGIGLSRNAFPKEKCGLYR